MVVVFLFRLIETKILGLVGVVDKFWLVVQAKNKREEVSGCTIMEDFYFYLLPGAEVFFTSWEDSGW